MWNTLQTLYEGNEDVKDSKINMLTKEYGLFCMEPRKSEEFNKLDNLENTISKKDCANKILRSICREW